MPTTAASPSARSRYSEGEGEPVAHVVGTYAIPAQRD